MAVVLVEGWDHLTAAEVSAKGWAAVSSMTTGRFSGQAARFTNSNSLRAKTLPSNYSTIFFGFAINMSTVNSASTVFALRAGATNTMQLQFDVSGHIVIKNSAGTTIATGTAVLAPGTWYYIEIKLVINGASGTVEVRLNGAAEIASTTGNFGSSNIDTVALSGFTGAGINVDFDDMYALDTTGSAPRNTFLGDVRVQTVFPTSDGAHTQWTPNSGSTHYTQVGETLADGDTTYVGDGTPNDIDSYGCGDIDTGATVYGVQTNLYARKDDAATRQIAPLIRQASTDYVGTTVTLSASYLFYSQIYNQDPTNADWTPTNVNADEFGVKEIA